MSTGHVSESKDKPFTAQDLRFTTRDEVLYVTGLAWPKSNRITVRTLAEASELYSEEIESVELLGSDSKLTWDRDQNGLHVQLPASAKMDYAYVLKISR